MLLCLGYGGADFYFNHFLHDFNRESSTFFYELAKRNSYGVALTGIMREAVRLGDKTMLGNNPGICTVYNQGHRFGWRRRDVHAGLHRRAAAGGEKH